MAEPTKIYIEVVTTNRVDRRTWEVLGTIRRVLDDSSVARVSGGSWQSEPNAIRSGMGSIGVAIGNLNNAKVAEEFDVDTIEFRFSKVTV